MKAENPFKHSNNWYKLDSAGVIYPSVVSSKITTLFRLSCDLVDAVIPETLQEALDAIMHRFPYFQVSLRRGFFWYYFDSHPGNLKIVQDTKIPCIAFSLKRHLTFPFRVLFFNKRIAVEFSHSLTDGMAALSFLKSLIAKYLELKGFPMPDTPDIHRDTEEPLKEEAEDAYKRYFKRNLPFPIKPDQSFRIPFRKDYTKYYYITTGIMPVEPLLAKAHEYNVTLTEYLIAVYFEVLQEFMIDYYRLKHKKRYKAIRVMIPINLRNLYPSKTMKNFTLFVAPGIDPRLGFFTFEDIIKKVHHYLKLEVNEKTILQQVSRNVKGLELIRWMPLFMKNLILSALYNSFGERIYTTSVSNLGVVKLPPEMAKHISRFEFYPPVNPMTGINCSIISYEDKLYYSFGRTWQVPEIEKRFFTKLIKLGIPVKIEANYQW